MPEGTVAVKICGLTRRQDVLAAHELGVEYLGVVLTAGFGRSVDPALAPGLMEGIAATPVAVLVDESPDTAEARARALMAGVIQLHGNESPDVARETALRGPWKVWKAVRAATASDVGRAVDAFAGAVDGLLVEGSRPGVIGGGGVQVDAEALHGLRNLLPPSLTFVLAGGLTPENVAEAMARFSPDVVDVSSGVERERGRKEPLLLRRFVQEARRAAAELPGSAPSKPGPDRDRRHFRT